jgi:diphosphomevalonate decarboxylase
MHAVCLAADPPILYWLPQTVALLHACVELRNSGIAAFETMDAGPQVKVLCLESDLRAVSACLTKAVPGTELLLARPGTAPELIDLGEGDPDPAPLIPVHIDGRRNPS